MMIDLVFSIFSGVISQVVRISAAPLCTNFADVLTSTDMLNFMKIRIKLFRSSFEVVLNSFNDIC